VPAVLKPDRSWNLGRRLGSLLVTSDAAARAAFDLISSQGGTVTVQEWLPGRRDAVMLLIDDGEVKACFAQTSHRELPRLGGVSVLSESIEPLDDIVRPARRLATDIGLEGCSLVEFRRDASGRPALLEVNPRVPGSVALAVASGIDVPGMLYTWATGGRVPPVSEYRVGTRLRWLAGDIWSFYGTMRSPGPESPSRRDVVGEFVRDSFRCHDVKGTFDVRDPLPGLIEAYQTVEELARRARRVATSRGRFGENGRGDG
jgi:predicted ATP-grasp superfamily ATP-dependent carboligase